MCLETVTENFETPRKGVGVGYKFFSERKAHDYELWSPCWKTFYEFQENVWQKDEAVGTLYPIWAGEYQKGFHIFTNKQDALDCMNDWLFQGNTNLVLREVEYDDVVAIGINEVCHGRYGECVVARSIFVKSDDKEGQSVA